MQVILRSAPLKAPHPPGSVLRTEPQPDVRGSVGLLRPAKIFFALFALMGLTSLLQAQPACVYDPQDLDALPPIGRSFSEAIPRTPGLVCTGGTPGAQATLRLNVFSNVPITNQLLARDTDETNALLILGNPGPNAVVGGGQLFPLRRSPINGSELFAVIDYTFPADASPIRFRFSNIRVDATQLSAATDPLGFLVFVDGVPVGNPIDIAQSTGELPASFEFLNRGEAGVDAVFVGAVGISENWSGAFRPRTLFGSAPPNGFDDQALWGASQSQYIPHDGRGGGDQRFAADAGNRFQLEFRGLPEGVTAVTHPIFSDVAVRKALALGLVAGSSEQLLGGRSLAGMAPDAVVESEPTAYDFGLAQQLLVEAGWVDEPSLATEGERASFLIPIGWNCEDPASLTTAEVTVTVRHAPWPLGAAPLPLSEEKNGFSGSGRPIPGPAFDPNVGAAEGITFDPADCNRLAQPRPMISEGGAVNGASFDGPAAPGSILSLFGTGLGPMEPQGAAAIPLPTELGGVEVEVNGVRVPLLFVSLQQINFQIPQEVTPSGQLAAEIGPAQASTATVVVRRNGIESDPVEIPLSAANPGVFTLDGGLGRAIAINPDGSLAHPADSYPGLATRPSVIGEALVLLATGLGVTTPPGVTGDDSLDEAGAFVRRDTVLTPRVLIGGVEAQLLFSGLSPQFVGVYQLNVIPAAGTPAGDAQPLVIEMNGVSSRADVTIAVAGP